MLYCSLKRIPFLLCRSFCGGRLRNRFLLQSSMRQRRSGNATDPRGKRVPSPEAHWRLFMKTAFPRLSLLLLLIAWSGATSDSAQADNTASVGKNYSMICGGNDYRRCDPSGNKQNEPSFAVSSRNPKNIIGGVNDYRGVDWMKLTDGKAGGPFVSVLMSADGGVTWKGTLHPGCPESDPACDGAPEIKGLPEASDPTVRCGPNGVCGFTAVAFDRVTHDGKFFASIWIDDNIPSKVNENTFRHLRTRVLEINTGQAGQGTDKPWLAIDKWRWDDPGMIFIPARIAGGQTVVAAQSFPYGRI